MHSFLLAPLDQLDAGVSAQLHTLAWSHRPDATEMAAARWLLRPAVQELFDKICEACLATSLPVERRHAEIKKWEASKLTHIATASRNAIQMRYLR